MTYFIIRTATTLSFPTGIIFSTYSAKRAEKVLEKYQESEQESQFRMLDESFTCVDTGDSFLNLTKSMSLAELVGYVSGKDVAERRLSMLEALGKQVQYRETRWNFGTSGTVKQEEDGFAVQLGAARGGKAPNGFSVNACDVVVVK